MGIGAALSLLFGCGLMALLFFRLHARAETNEFDPAVVCADEMLAAAMRIFYQTGR
jgi:hypothetical protein